MGPMDINDILDSVAKDFFGSSDESYKDLLKGSSLDELEENLKKIGASDRQDAISEELRKTTALLSRLDEAVLGAGHTTGAESHADAADSLSQDSVSSSLASALIHEEEAAALQQPAEPEKTGMEELNELIGLQDIKNDVRELVSFMKVQKKREALGSKSVPVSLHLVFTGNPGTGKTTIARILARLYSEIGVLSRGQLVEVDRSGLVAGYVGQTAIKTQEKIQEALGGILFIDEAYALAKDGNDYGQEAIDTILKAMEDHRDDFIVIVAGYTEPMKTFIESNPGLKSRFNKFIEFPDYSPEELREIFLMRCSKYGYTLSDDAMKSLETIMQYRTSHKDPNFANAREARNIFEAVITNQATRLAEMEELPDELLNVLEAADFEELMPDVEEAD